MPDPDFTTEGAGVSADESEIASVLDEAHARARRAFGAKDLAAYMAMFAPEVVYTKHYGQVIDRAGLARDVEKQFRTLASVESSFRRASLEVTQSGAVEVLVQEASGRMAAFGGLLRREWKRIGEARYVWEKRPAGWCIVKVEVLNEVVGAKFGLGRSP